MKLRTVLSTLALVAVICGPWNQAARAGIGTMLGFNAGATIPTGGWDDYTNPSFRAGANMQSVQAGSMAFGGELSYNDFVGDESQIRPEVDWNTLETSFSIFEISGYFKWFYLPKKPVKAYLSAGLGFYMKNIKVQGEGFSESLGQPVKVDESSRPTSVGANFGLGFQFPLGRNAFDLAARWQYLFDSTTIAGVSYDGTSYVAISLTFLWKT